MDLDEVEVRESETMPGQQRRHGKDRRREQAIRSVDVVDGRGLPVDEPRERGDAVGRSPISARQQHGRGAVGERGGVAGRHRGALASAENRCERSEFLHGRVGTEVTVARQPEVGGHQIVEEPAIVCRREVAVAGNGKLVLSLASDAPFLGGHRHVLAHRHAGAGLDVLRDGRSEVPGPDARDDLGAVHRGLGPVEPQQHSEQLIGQGHRRVAGGVGAPRDAAVDLTESNLVGDEDCGLQTCAARLLEVVGRRGGVQRRAQDALAGEVPVAGVLEHGTGHDLPEPLPRQPEPSDQPVERRGEQVGIGGLGVGSPRPGERDSVAAQDGDPAWTGLAHSDSLTARHTDLARLHRQRMGLSGQKVCPRPGTGPAANTKPGREGRPG